MLPVQNALRAPTSGSLVSTQLCLVTGEPRGPQNLSFLIDETVAYVPRGLVSLMARCQSSSGAVPERLPHPEWLVLGLLLISLYCLIYI